MFKQPGIILVCCLILLIGLCASEAFIQRGAGAGNYNGVGNIYKTFCYGDRNSDRKREEDAQLCLDELYKAQKQPWGCKTVSRGRSRCTVDSSYIIFGANGRWAKTFKEARANLYRECRDFTRTTMERYEGTLYLALTCK